jgi:hydroxypyruvate isomerase
MDLLGRHAPGRGTMDSAAIYRELRQQGYRGWVATEFLPIGDAASELRRAASEIS